MVCLLQCAMFGSRIEHQIICEHDYYLFCGLGGDPGDNTS